jgi:hypothetical protein
MSRYQHYVTQGKGASKSIHDPIRGVRIHQPSSEPILAIFGSLRQLS